MPKKDENQEPTTSRFAHLFGFGKPNAAKAEEDDEQKEKEMSEEEKDEKAEYDEDEKPEAEDEEKEEKAKKAGALAERARCAAIFSAKSASVRPDMAAHLAFETDMSADEATAMLDKIAMGKNTQAQSNGLRQRMAEVTQPKISASSPIASEPKSFVDGLVAYAQSRK